MGKQIPVKAGDKIPLNAQEGFKDTTKVIFATLYNLSTGGVIAANISLSHISDGTYTNNSITMPAGVDFVFARYDVFDAGGVIPNSTGPSAVSDIFVPDVEISQDVIDKLNQVIDIVTSHDLNSQLIGIVDDTSELVGVVQPEDAIGFIDDDRVLVGIIQEITDISGDINDDDNITGIIS